MNAHKRFSLIPVFITVLAVCGGFSRPLTASDGFSTSLPGPAAPRCFTLEAVGPRVFSPNGDSRNDYVEFRYANPSDANVIGRVFDLQGCMVGEMRKGSRENTLIWDGTALAGGISTPGVYIYQIELTGSETLCMSGIVVLAR